MTELKRMTQEEYRAIPGAEPLEPLPMDSVVIAALQDGQVVGRVALLNMLHLEGMWIRRSHRNGHLLSRVIQEAQQQARDIGASTVIAYTAEPKHGEYMQRLSYDRLPVEVWLKEI